MGRSCRNKKIKMRLGKFYRYIIYRLYTYWNGNDLETPIANIILTLSAMHIFQLYTVYAVLQRFFLQSLDVIFSIGKVGILTIHGLILLINYFTLYNKKQWALYFEEFNNETAKHRKVGNILIVGYIFGSFALFFITIPLIFK